jgi:hypothetical protein
VSAKQIAKVMVTENAVCGMQEALTPQTALVFHTKLMELYQYKTSLIRYANMFEKKDRSYQKSLSSLKYAARMNETRQLVQLYDT